MIVSGKSKGTQSYIYGTHSPPNVPPPPARLPHDIEQSSLCSTIGSLVIQIKISNEVNYYAIISGESKMVMSLIFES